MHFTLYVGFAPFVNAYMVTLEEIALSLIAIIEVKYSTIANETILCFILCLGPLPPDDHRIFPSRCHLSTDNLQH
jgi:hypothetical protein